MGKDLVLVSVYALLALVSAALVQQGVAWAKGREHTLLASSFVFALVLVTCLRALGRL